MKSVWLIGATAACVATASLPSRAAELLTNGSFEDVKDGKTVGWNVPEHYAFADGVGMNGTRGILFENRDDRKYYRYPSAQIPFEKGKRYEYSVWAKTEGLKGRAQLCVEWYDAKGKWMSGSYQGGFGGTHDWMQLMGTGLMEFKIDVSAGGSTVTVRSKSDYPINGDYAMPEGSKVGTCRVTQELVIDFAGAKPEISGYKVGQALI